MIQFNPNGTVLKATSEFHPKFAPLFRPARYKIFHGGRAGMKSWSIAKALVTLASQRRLLILCARELQNSIDDSVHRLLKGQIERLGLNSIYDIQRDRIRCTLTGSEFIFEGLRYNVNSIKSIEDVDIVWIEEAVNVSKHSWDTLIPTIRKSGSEIWISFNPELDTDETYKRFVKSPPTGAIVVKVGYEDNPWLTSELVQEMLDCRARSQDDFDNIWGGLCRKTLEGAIYADEIRDAEYGQRIGYVPHIVGKPVHTFWDLGKSDLTAIWFVQVVGFEHRVIDFYANTGKDLEHYLMALQQRRYVYGDTWLPHDAQHDVLVSKKTIEQQTKEAGFNVRIVPKVSIVNGINAARTIFPRCVFDRNHCEDGLEALRHYRYAVDVQTGRRSKLPYHDWASNGADAWRYHAVALQDGKPDEIKLNLDAPKLNLNPQPGSWMGH